MINVVMVTGRLGSDPEMKKTDGGLAVAKFSVAITEVRGKGDARTERTHWINCTAFGGVAEAVGKYVKKGTKVTVHGRLNQNKWETDDGKKLSKLEVIAENIEFMTNGNSKEKATTEAAPDDEVPFE